MGTLKIAVDGPSGAGKSSLAKNISKNLGILYMDTGALYRTIGLYVRRCGKNPKSAEEVEPLLENIEISLSFGENGQSVILNGEDVSGLIRTPEMSMYASAVSALPCVRKFLLNTQRSIAEASDIIMDGRDIGTVILPDADVKIFLTASIEERAARRFDELTRKGETVDYETVLAEMKERDSADSGRDIAPAVPADDAVILDNSGFEEKDTLNRAIEIIKSKTDKI